MATEPMSIDKPTRQVAAHSDLPPSQAEQEDYEYVMGQIDALIGRLDIQQALLSARLDRLLERMKSRAPR
jgi:hypothetical protein